jgi:hypothetical protein
MWLGTNILFRFFGQVCVLMRWQSIYCSRQWSVRNLNMGIWFGIKLWSTMTINSVTKTMNYSQNWNKSTVITFIFCISGMKVWRYQMLFDRISIVVWLTLVQKVDWNRFYFCWFGDVDSMLLIPLVDALSLRVCTSQAPVSYTNEKLIDGFNSLYPYRALHYGFYGIYMFLGICIYSTLHLLV